MIAYEFGTPITKTITAKNTRWAWSTPDSILLNETLCLHRLRDQQGFPQIISTHWQNHTIDMTYVGRTLHWYWKRGLRPTVYNPREQLERLFGTLESLKIAHLDMHPNGKNCCLHEGELYIIDFGVAVRDGTPTSERLNTLYNTHVQNGAYEHLTHIMLSQIYANCNVKHNSTLL